MEAARRSPGRDALRDLFFPNMQFNQLQTVFRAHEARQAGKSLVKVRCAIRTWTWRICACVSIDAFLRSMRSLRARRYFATTLVNTCSRWRRQPTFSDQSAPAYQSMQERVCSFALGLAPSHLSTRNELGTICSSAWLSYRVLMCPSHQSPSCGRRRKNLGHAIESHHTASLCSAFDSDAFGEAILKPEAVMLRLLSNILVGRGQDAVTSDLHCHHPPIPPQHTLSPPLGCATPARRAPAHSARG